MDKEKLIKLAVKAGVVLAVGIPATALAKTLTNLTNQHFIDPLVENRAAADELRTESIEGGIVAVPVLCAGDAQSRIRMTVRHREAFLGYFISEGVYDGLVK